MKKYTYDILSKNYSILSEIGFVKYRSKLWILLEMFYGDPKNEGFDINRLGRVKCNSLKEECSDFGRIINIVQELHNLKIITGTGVQFMYTLPGNTASNLNDLISDVNEKAKSIDGMNTVKDLFTICTNNTTLKINEEDNKLLKFDFKKFLPNLITMSAKGAIDVMLELLKLNLPPLRS